MPLNDVAVGDPHVAAHNDERAAINGLQAAIDGMSTGSTPGIEDVYAQNISGNYQILDVDSATLHRLILTGDVVFTFPTADVGKSFVVALTQDATGGRSVTWPGSVKWPGGVAPTITATANKIDVFNFICFDGTNWLGFIGGQGF